MSEHQHTPAPWTETTAVFIPAGDDRLMAGGRPFSVDCRVLSEPNYQLAMRAVNAHDSMVEALKLAREHLVNLGAAVENPIMWQINAAIDSAEPKRGDKEVIVWTKKKRHLVRPERKAG
ncbi:hypothetical protein [Mesorhizobium sp. M1B.F.Ca.ET.045.04.1.1]|uniref:hypothetical protein n=1 Tax=Mesorhizobium sp. M1B.F.Ca.ET.045.04.1.1 TaxID=2493673 RepID=UPI000F75FD0A|nr:hypothetical protein [Mesorhizobium sp. M1B.F.Ca.ET.045.04.1.1]AZO29382.1 hypothetical protein EJ071_19645 [Mesorhizobium sp. M1B.F.Ca.ET.045.04.1.1]